MNRYIHYHIPRLAAEPQELTNLMDMQRNLRNLSRRIVVEHAPVVINALTNVLNTITLAIRQGRELYSPARREAFIRLEDASHDALDYFYIVLDVNNFLNELVVALVLRQGL